MYLPTLSQNSSIQVNLEVLLRIESNLKLNVFKETIEEIEGVKQTKIVKLIEEKSLPKREVHYIKMEGI